MGPLPVRKTANVGVSPGPIVVVAVCVGVVGLMQAPVDGLISHTVMATGSIAEPVPGELIVKPLREADRVPGSESANGTHRTWCAI